MGRSRISLRSIRATRSYCGSPEPDGRVPAPSVGRLADRQQALPHANQAGASRPPPRECVLAADGVAGPELWRDGDCRRRTAPPTARLADPLGPAVPGAMMLTGGIDWDDGKS